MHIYSRCKKKVYQNKVINITVITARAWPILTAVISPHPEFFLYKPLSWFVLAPNHWMGRRLLI